MPSPNFVRSGPTKILSHRLPRLLTYCGHHRRRHIQSAAGAGGSRPPLLRYLRLQLCLYPLPRVRRPQRFPRRRPLHIWPHGGVSGPARLPPTRRRMPELCLKAILGMAWSSRRAPPRLVSGSSARASPLPSTPRPRVLARCSLTLMRALVMRGAMSFPCARSRRASRFEKASQAWDTATDGAVLHGMYPTLMCARYIHISILLWMQRITERRAV